MESDIILSVKADGLLIEVPPSENIAIIEKLIELTKITLLQESS